MVDSINGLFRGEPGSWIAFSIVAGCVSFFILYEKVTGKPFVKSKEERRTARNRRKIVLWEYRRGD